MYNLENSSGAMGTFLTTANGEIVAIIPILHNVAHTPRLYRKFPLDYNRVEMPQYIANTYLSVLHYGMDIFYGADSDAYFADSDAYFGGPGYVSSVSSSTVTQIWDVVFELTSITVNGITVDVPANSLIIYRYDNTYDWYLDYAVPATDCPFCGGSRVRHDFILTALGQLARVYDMNKLSQEVLKSVITRKGKNSYFPNYGTTLLDTIGQKINATWGLRSQITEQLETIKRYQNMILAITPEMYSARELLDDLLGIKVFPTTDPRNMELTVTILNRAAERADSKTLRIK